MMTFEQFSHGIEPVTAVVSWCPSDLGVFTGRRVLFAGQSPQRLKALGEHTIIECAVTSNRIEVAGVDNRRVGTVVFGTSLMCDRSEEVVQDYREALGLIHEQGAKQPASEKTTLDRVQRASWSEAGKRRN